MRHSQHCGLGTIRGGLWKWRLLRTRMEFSRNCGNKTGIQKARTLHMCCSVLLRKSLNVKVQEKLLASHYYETFLYFANGDIPKVRNTSKGNVAHELINYCDIYSYESSAAWFPESRAKIYWGLLYLYKWQQICKNAFEMKFRKIHRREDAVFQGLNMRRKCQGSD